MAVMKENTRRVFEFVKENEGLTADEIAAGLSKEYGEEITTRSVVGSFNSFVKKGWAYRKEELVLGGKTKHLYLTDEGKAVDLDELCAPAEDAE